jgi:biopolymer transport protein ExbD
MADFQPSASGKARRKLSTPRIDLTPMVDLGFLLITFFMYTTTMAKPKVMEIAAPPRDMAGGTAVPAEATLVLLPTADHRIAYYRGTEEATMNLQPCSFNGANSLRRLLEQESARVKALPANYSKEAHELHVLIKPDTAAAYEDIVNTLDEMNIAAVPYYTLMRISVTEQHAIKIFLAGSYGKQNASGL